MSNLNTYPVQINNTDLPMAISWNETAEVVENANTTEAGTDIVDILRVDKLTVNASFNVSSAWLSTFKTWANDTSKLTVKIYDSVTSGYLTRYMRIRNFNYTLVENSDKNNGTIGLWTVTFDLIEF